MSDPAKALAKARLFLVAGGISSGEGTAYRLVEEALMGGVDIVQLRDYSVKDAVLLKMAHEFREITRQYGALFIVNNRPEIAALSDADGVHLGQEDLSVLDARKILGPGKLVGVSTHAPDQACMATAHGADYIGVGPIYATPTKPEGKAVSVEYIRQLASMRTSLPFFAIGGIDLTNLDEVLGAGCRRIAVVRAICDADNPRLAAAELKKRMTAFPLE